MILAAARFRYGVALRENRKVTGAGPVASQSSERDATIRLLDQAELIAVGFERRITNMKTGKLRTAAAVERTEAGRMVGRRDAVDSTAAFARS